MKDYRTDTQIKREQTDSRLYAAYMQIMNEPGEKSKQKVYQELMEKFDIHSISTIYIMIKRAKAREAQIMKGGIK